MSRDAVVIGAGINGLVAAWRLARSGMRVLVLEKQEAAGGSLVTEEIAPGFRVDAVRHDVGWVPPELLSGLDLARRGVELVRPDPALVAPLSDGGHVSLSSDPVRSAQSIRGLSPRDADRWPTFARLTTRLAGFLETLYRAPALRVPGEGLGDLVAMARVALRLRRLGRRDMVELLRTIPMPVADLLDDWLESDALKGLVGAMGVRGIRQGPRSGGTAFVLLHHLVGGSWCVVRGGVGKLAEALVAAAREAGAEIRTGVEVAHITVTGGRATGVVTATGEEIGGPVVLSGADPRRTLLGLVHPIHLDPEITRAVHSIRFRGAVAKVNLALDALPRFRGIAAGAPELGGAITIAPSLDYLERAYDDAKHGGTSAQPALEIRIPSLLDPGLAPAGKHVASIWVQYVPYGKGKREGGSGKRGAKAGKREAGSGKRVYDTVIETLEEYAPGVRALVRASQVLTPEDLEARYGLTEGSLYHGEMALDQILFMRPVSGWARYRTPIAGLYLCGAGTHPGGATAGACGWLAAGAALGDAKRGAR